MVLGPGSYPAEINCAAAFVLRNGKFSRLGAVAGGSSPPIPPLSLTPTHNVCKLGDFYIYIELFDSSILPTMLCVMHKLYTYIHLKLPII